MASHSATRAGSPSRTNDTDVLIVYPRTGKQRIKARATTERPHQRDGMW